MEASTYQGEEGKETAVTAAKEKAKACPECR